MKKYVLYHAGCSDGYCAAFLFQKYLDVGDDLTLIPVQYGQPVPSDIEPDSDVYIVDFSYSLQELQELAGKVTKLTVLDHHKTAQLALASFSAPNARCVFDMSRSGAQLAFDELDKENAGFYPCLVQFVADRDLWKFELPYSREVNLYIQTFQHTFNVWKELWWDMENALNQVQTIGLSLKKFQEQQIKRALHHTRIQTWTVIYDHPRFEHYKVAVVNSPNFQSEIGEALCLDKENPVDFACVWYQNKDGLFIHSLRSNSKDANSVDVAEVAKRYGGGGHKNAAGFTSTNPRVLWTPS